MNRREARSARAGPSAPAGFRHAELTDIRACTTSHPEWYDPEQYAASQRLGRELRQAGGNGLVYASVRHADGECIAVFRPCLLSPARQGPHLTYVWDGDRIVGVYKEREFRFRP